MRNYGIGIGKTAERLGEARPLASVTEEEIGEALELLWGGAAVNTWNAREPDNPTLTPPRPALAARCCRRPSEAATGRRACSPEDIPTIYFW